LTIKYRNGKYHSLKTIAKKIPLPMSGEEGWDTEL